MTEEQMDNATNAVEEQETTTTTTANETTGTSELEERIAKLEKESADHRDNWLRAVADYKNFKRRVDQERADLIRSAGAGLLLKVLPVVDDINRALDSAPADIAATPWYEGVKLIAQKFQTVLESEGVTQIAALGQDFDPNLHEAVIYEAAGEGQEGKVVGELQKGYKLRDRVLRPAMVKVGRE